MNYQFEKKYCKKCSHKKPEYDVYRKRPYWVCGLSENNKCSRVICARYLKLLDLPSLLGHLPNTDFETPQGEVMMNIINKCPHRDNLPPMDKIKLLQKLKKI